MTLWLGMNKFINRLLSIVLLGILFAFSFIPTANSAPASQGYNAQQQLPEGALVARKDDGVVLADISNINTLLGVVVTPQDYLVNIDATKTVQVITNGAALTLLSDINGEVRTGDPVTASPIGGVAMKATESTKVLGIAQADLSSATQTQKERIKDKYGKIKDVKIGRIAVDINVLDLNIDGGKNSDVVSGLQTVASSAAGKQVSTVRAVIAFIVLLLALALSIIVLYSGVSSSIRSIGRNPLSKRFVIQGLIQVIFAVFIIMIAAFSVVYIIIGS